jgi:hypothetical protein
MVSTVGAAWSAGSKGRDMGVSQRMEAIGGAGLARRFASRAAAVVVATGPAR